MGIGVIEGLNPDWGEGSTRVSLRSNMLFLLAVPDFVFEELDGYGPPQEKGYSNEVNKTEKTSQKKNTGTRKLLAKKTADISDIPVKTRRVVSSLHDDPSISVVFILESRCVAKRRFIHHLLSYHSWPTIMI